MFLSNIEHLCQFWVNFDWFNSFMGHVFQLLCMSAVEFWKFLCCFQYSRALFGDAAKLFGNSLILLDLVLRSSRWEQSNVQANANFCPSVKVRPFCVIQPNVLWVMKFSSLTGESRHSSQTVSAAGTFTSNCFGWIVSKTEEVSLNAYANQYSAELLAWLSVHFWSFLSVKPSLLYHSDVWAPATMIFLDSQLCPPNSGTIRLCWVTPALHMACNSPKAWKLGWGWSPVSQDPCPSLPEIQCLEIHCFIYFVWCFCCFRQEGKSSPCDATLAGRTRSFDLTEYCRFKKWNRVIIKFIHINIYLET